MYKLGVECCPKPWIVDKIQNRCFDVFCEDGKFLILNETTARQYYTFGADDEMIDSTQGTGDQEHYVTIGSDGEHCLKTYFMKNSFGVDETLTQSQDSQGPLDWRHASVWLTRYFLTVTTPTNSDKPEIILIVESCNILRSSELDAKDFTAGFMNHCMELKMAKSVATEVWKEKVEKRCSLKVLNENNHELSWLISLLSHSNEEIVEKVDISNEESDDVEPPKKTSRLSVSRANVPQLWANSEKDVPSGSGKKDQTQRRSPDVVFISSGSSGETTQPPGSSVEVVNANNDQHPSTCIPSAIRPEEDEFVQVRSVWIQTDSSVTGWTNDQACGLDENSSIVSANSRNICEDNLKRQTLEDKKSPKRGVETVSKHSPVKTIEKVDWSKSVDSDVELIMETPPEYIDSTSFTKKKSDGRKHSPEKARNTQNVEDDTVSVENCLEQDEADPSDVHICSQTRNRAQRAKQAKKWIRNELSKEALDEPANELHMNFALSDYLRKKCLDVMFGAQDPSL